MNSAWHVEPFEAVLGDESAGNVKTPQSEFKKTGCYPIVDQGKELIAGYIDDASRLCVAELPAIVFGDHTRCVKYIDFPFCLGADGVKVLRPKIDADVKYLYHYLRQLHLTDGGYDRHYKYLKRTRVVLPPIAEQRRIAAILDKADALRAKRRAALAHLETLAQSIFLHMFGDPIIDQKEWKTRRLAEVSTLITDGTHKTPNYQNSGVEFLSAKDLKEGGIAWGSEKYISEEEHRELVRRCNPELGDVLLAKSGSLGSVAIIDRSHAFSLFESLCLIKQDRKQIDAIFLTSLLRMPSMKQHLLGKNKGVAIKHLHLLDVRNLSVIVPRIDLQREFARRVVKVEKLKASQRECLRRHDMLFNGLQHRAFRAEL